MLQGSLVYEKHVTGSRGERVEGEGVGLGMGHWMHTMNDFVC